MGEIWWILEQGCGHQVWEDGASALNWRETPSVTSAIFLVENMRRVMEIINLQNCRGTDGTGSSGVEGEEKRVVNNEDLVPAYTPV